MTSQTAVPQVQTEPGEASAEDGFVILDGPGGVAVTMTVDAATGTGNSLLAAAQVAAAQIDVDRPMPDSATETD
ncbi:MAG: hypothetical protein EOP17_02545 [Rhizobiaceae bacterium]|nr:MAG: hypothetical protein EOP17_02545 [Rhizobiaceae bacterium]